MISAPLQIKSISVLLYRDFKYKTETEIEDLKAIALSEDRARVELICKLAIPVQPSNLVQLFPGEFGNTNPVQFFNSAQPFNSLLGIGLFPGPFGNTNRF